MALETIKNFTNIDEEDFEGMYGGEVIPLRRGETKAFTGRIAKHLAGQLAYKILLRQKKEPHTDSSRPGLIDKMLGEVVAPPPLPIEPVEAPEKEAEKEEEFPEIKEETKEEVKPKRRRAKK